MKKWLKRIGTGIAVILAVIIVGILFVAIMPGWGLYFVQSGSMEPGISPGDLVITKPPTNYDIGTIITFKQNAATVTHRIIGLNADGTIQTKGDANEDPDPHPLNASNIEGVFLFNIPKLGYINSLVSSRKGWFFIIIIPTIALVVFIVKDIVKETFKGSKNEKKTEGGQIIAGTEKKDQENTVNNGDQTQSNKQ